MWGNLDVGAERRRFSRFTPTRVGKSSPSGFPDPRRSVHPHACGEISACAPANASANGSPPRVWGNRPGCARGSGSPRFTPTRVGKSGSLVVICNPSTVHPHACGEIGAASLPSVPSSGSPPRVWGNRACLARRTRRPRFTPTRVGKSRSPSASAQSRSVHPHACGEIGVTSSMASRSRGSPPRVWGNRLPNCTTFPIRRFTPTRVGKSRDRRATPINKAVHPHACGEIGAVQKAGGAIGGSPPRVWGNQGGRAGVREYQRFTPTRVGKSSPGGNRAPGRAVHPHACGEIDLTMTAADASSGSPPRVWGNRGAAEARWAERRFTPTRVGKSR